MRNTVAYFLFAILALASGCEFMGLGDSGEDGVSTRLTVLDRSTQRDSLPSDAAAVDGVILKGDMLKLEISYSGGCVDDHEFNLVWFGSFVETNPVIADLWLTHDAKGDACRMFLTKELAYDISALEREYRRQYSQAYSPDRFIIHLLQPTGRQGEFEHSDSDSPLYVGDSGAS